MNSKQVAGTILSTIIKIVVVVVIVFFVYKAAVIAYDYGYRIFAEGPVSEAPGFDVTIAITGDESVKSIGELLESRGLIRDSKLFILQELLPEHHGKIKAGTYTLNTSMTVEQMLSVMAGDDEKTGETAETAVPESMGEMLETGETGEPEETVEPESSEETP